VSIESRGVSPSNDTRNFFFFHDSFVVISFFYFCTDKMAMRETFCSIRQTNWSGFNTVLGTHTRIIYYSIEKIDKFTLG
jgi:hypothetical protein